MLAFQHFALTPTPHSFLPMCPSPLSPRSINVQSRRPNMNSTSAGEKSPASAGKQTAFSKRDIKKAPSPRSDELREQRRTAFLNKVKVGRDDKRYELREEDMMRLDHVRQQRIWRANQAQSAPVFDTDFEDFDVTEEKDADMQLPSSSNYAPEDEVDQVLQMEDEEIEALLDFMQPEEELDELQWSGPEHFGSDDEDYDELFMDMLAQEERNAKEDGCIDTHSADQGDSMDLS